MAKPNSNGELASTLRMVVCTVLGEKAPLPSVAHMAIGAIGWRPSVAPPINDTNAAWSPEAKTQERRS